MKLVKLFFILSLVLTLNSCGEEISEGNSSQNNSSDLVGTWVLDDISLGNMGDMPEAQVEMMKGMMDMMKGKMKFTFNTDGTTAVNSEIMGESVNETGKYSTDNGVITIESPEKGKQEMDYAIAGGKLTISSTENGQEITMMFVKE